MSGKKRLALVMAVVVALAGMGVTAWTAEGAAAGAGEGGLAGGRPLVRCLRETVRMLRELRQELDLTPEQKREIGIILKDYREETVAVIRAVHDRRVALMHAVRSDTIDERAIRRAAGALGEAIGDGAVLRARVRQQVRPVLTEEQRDKVDATIEAIEELWAEAIDDLDKK